MRALFILIGVACAACSQLGGSEDTSARIADADQPAQAVLNDDEEEQEIPLSQVPQNVKDAALAALPGFVAEEAEREVEDGVTVYCLEGTVGGEEYEIEVTSGGKVVEIESADDEDEDDEEDEGDDEEDEDDEED